MNRLWVNLAIFTLPVFAFVTLAYTQDMEQSIYVEESRSKEYAVKAHVAESRNDWKEAINIYMKIIDKFPTEVMKVGEKKWLGIPEFVLERLSKMPKDVLAQYRFEFDAKAGHEFESARNNGDLTLLENLLYKYFYASQSDYQIDWLANNYFESGELGEAAYWWQHLLRYYPDIKISRTNVASKLIMALKVLGDETAIETLKGEFPDKFEKANIYKLANAKMATIPQEHNVKMLRNDIRRWYKPISHKSVLEGGVNPVPRRAMGGFAQQESLLGISNTANALIASYAKIDNLEYVFYQNGVEASAVEPISGKVYWSTMPDKTANVVGSSFILNSTVDIDTKIVFFNMFTTPNQKDKAQRRPFNIPYSFNLPNSICAIKATTGKLLWITDYDEISDRLKNKEFGFCSAPVVVGQKLFVGLISSPISEPESYVACLDKDTGKLLWLTFLCSLVGQQYYYDSYGSNFYSSSIISENAGILYVLTNLGTMVAVNKNTGNIIWLTKYKRKSRQEYYRRQESTNPPNYPIVYKNYIYCLPQDSDYLFIFDKYTGDIKDYINCKEAAYLLAVEDDTAIMSRNYIYKVDLKEMDKRPRQEELPEGATKFPRGAIYNGIAYIPTNKGISTVNLLTLKTVEYIKEWREDNDCGNIIIAGDNIISISTTKISSYTNLEAIESEYKARLEQDPNPLTLVELGNLLYDNDVFEKANKCYLKYLERVGDDPKYETSTLEVEANLYKLNIKLGNDNLKKDETDIALDYFEKAKTYASDEEKLANTLAKLAQTYEAKGKPSTAIDHYQEILLKCKGAIYKESEDISYRFSSYARKRISEIVNKQGDAIYAKYDKLANGKLRKASNYNEALKEIIYEYPNSESAKEAIQRLIKMYNGKNNTALSLYYKHLLQSEYNVKGDLGLALSIVEDLEALNDTETLKAELVNLREPFGGMKIPYGDQTVGNFVAEKLKQIEQKQKNSNPLLALPLVKVADLDIDGYLLKPYDERFTTHSKGELFSNSTALKCVNVESGNTLWKYEPPKKAVSDYLGIIFEPTKDPTNSLNDAVKITGFKENAPALQFPAHMMVDDIITRINGNSFSIAQFIKLANDFRQGDKIDFTIIRKGKTLIRTMSLVVPNDVVSLKYTIDGAVILAYRNYLTKISMSDGKEIWGHNLAADEDKIAQLEITCDRVFILQSASTGKSRISYGDPTLSDLSLLQPPPFILGYKYTLTCFDLLTGDMEWSRNLSSLTIPIMNINIANNAIIINSANTYPSSYGNQQNLKFQLFNTINGEKLGDDKEFSNILQFNYDIRNNRLISISVEPNKNLTLLKIRNSPIDNNSNKEIEQKLDPLPPSAASYPILSSKNYLCLVSVVSGSIQPPNITVYNAADGKKLGNIYLPKDRKLATNYYPAITIENDDILYIYNAGVDNMGNRYLTAYSLSENIKVLWDVKIPNSSDSVIIDNSNTSFFVLLSEKNVATAIDKKTGAIQKFYNVSTIKRQIPLIEFAEYKNRVFKNAKGGTVEIFRQK